MSEKVIKDALDAFNKGDAASLGKLFGGGLGKGVAASVKSNRTAFPDLAYKIERVAADGDQVHFSYVAKGTHKGKLGGQAATNKSASWTGSGVASVQNGKIVGLQIYEDTIGRALQLGLKLGSAALPSLTGTWKGSSQGIDVTLILVQTGNSVTGTASAFGSTFPVTGSVSFPNVALQGSLNGLAVTYNGAYNPPPNTIIGTLVVQGVGTIPNLAITRQ
jgi:predicted ester cyclase